MKKMRKKLIFMVLMLSVTIMVMGMLPERTEAKTLSYYYGLVSLKGNKLKYVKISLKDIARRGEDDEAWGRVLKTVTLKVSSKCKFYQQDINENGYYYKKISRKTFAKRAGVEKMRKKNKTYAVSYRPLTIKKSKGKVVKAYLAWHP